MSRSYQSRRATSYGLTAFATVSLCAWAIGWGPGVTPHNPTDNAGAPSAPNTGALPVMNARIAPGDSDPVPPVGALPDLTVTPPSDGGFGTRADCNSNGTDDINDSIVRWDNGSSGNNYNTNQRGGAASVNTRQAVDDFTVVVAPGQARALVRATFRAGLSDANWVNGAITGQFVDNGTINIALYQGTNPGVNTDTPTTQSPITVNGVVQDFTVPYATKTTLASLNFGAAGTATLVEYVINNPGIMVPSTGRFYIAMRPVSNGTTGQAFWAPANNGPSPIRLFQAWRHTFPPASAWTALNQDLSFTLQFGTFADCDTNSVPDVCQLATQDCNHNGTLDTCELVSTFTNQTVITTAWGADFYTAFEYADDIVVPRARILSAVNFQTAETNAASGAVFSWDGSVRVAVYADAGGMPANTAPIASVIVNSGINKVDAGAFNATLEQFSYTVTGLSLPLPGATQTRYWLAFGPGATTGQTGNCFYVVRDTTTSGGTIGFPIFRRQIGAGFSWAEPGPPSHYDGVWVATLTDDCNANNTPDECDIAAMPSLDCNNDGILESCAITQDCDQNGTPDSCQPGYVDCNTNNAADFCDIAQGGSPDVNNNGIPDECEPDCNQNNLPDSFDIAQGTSLDCNSNVIPDECEADCNTNGTPDQCDITRGAPDCNNDGFPDSCNLAGAFKLDQEQLNNYAGGGNVIGLASDITINPPDPTFGADIRTAANFTLTTSVSVTSIQWFGGYTDTAGAPVGDPAPSPGTGVFVVKFWTDVSGAPGTVEATATFSGANANLLNQDVSGGAGLFWVYQGNLATPIVLNAGVHWFEVYNTETANTNTWTVLVSAGPETSTAQPVANSMQDTTWNLVYPNLPRSHILLGLIEALADANSNMIPDVCEFPGSCARCRGDVRGVADTDGNKARGDDLNDFVRCLITQSANLTTNGCGCADITGDGLINGADATAMAQLLLGVPCPTCGSNVCTP